MSAALRVACGAFALLFAFGAAVQWNDPDPLRWMAAYGAVTVLSAAAAAGRLWRWPTAVVLGGLLVFLVVWSPALGDTSLHAMRSFGMSGSETEEEVREAWGLILLVGWTAFLLSRAWRGGERAGRA